MVPACENLDLCGVIVDHLKARKRVPEGMGMMTVFSRDEWCKKNMEESDEVVLDQIFANLKPYYGDLSSEVVTYELGRWPVVVPKMPQGRFKQIATYEKSIDPKARVQFAGDLDPIGGVNAALVSGKKAAQRMVGQYA
jgi:protoporphyrinogen oxidase